MSFYDSVLTAIDNTIELHNQVKIIGKHSYKGKMGYVKQIRKEHLNDIYLIEMQIDGKTIECMAESLTKCM